MYFYPPPPAAVPGREQARCLVTRKAPPGVKERAAGSHMVSAAESSGGVDWSTPVFLPGESQGQGSLVGCRLWGLTESDMTEATQQQQQQQGAIKTKQKISN